MEHGMNCILCIGLDSGVEGFKTFLCYDDERSYSKGVFVITENKELMKQIDYLMRKAEMFR